MVLPAQEDGNDDNNKGQGGEIGREAGTIHKIAHGTLRVIAKLQLMAWGHPTGLCWARTTGKGEFFRQCGGHIRTR